MEWKGVYSFRVGFKVILWRMFPLFSYVEVVRGYCDNGPWHERERQVDTVPNITEACVGTRNNVLLHALSKILLRLFNGNKWS